jgi:hypothetical protein
MGYQIFLLFHFGIMINIALLNNSANAGCGCSKGNVVVPCNTGHQTSESPTHRTTTRNGFDDVVPPLPNSSSFGKQKSNLNNGTLQQQPKRQPIVNRTLVTGEGPVGEDIHAVPTDRNPETESNSSHVGHPQQPAIHEVTARPSTPQLERQIPIQKNHLQRVLAQTIHEKQSCRIQHQCRPRHELEKQVFIQTRNTAQQKFHAYITLNKQQVRMQQ